MTKVEFFKEKINFGKLYFHEIQLTRMHCFNMDISGDENRHGDPDSVPLHSGDLADVLRPQSHVRVAARLGCIHARLQHEEFGICG